MLVQDLTRIRRLETVRRDFISNLSHELRSPLASLSTATYLLLRPEMSQEKRNQIVNNIHNETLRLNSLASSFLDLARLESGRVQFRKTRFSEPLGHAFQADRVPVVAHEGPTKSGDPRRG